MSTLSTSRPPATASGPAGVSEITIMETHLGALGNADACRNGHWTVVNANGEPYADINAWEFPSTYPTLSLAACSMNEWGYTCAPPTEYPNLNDPSSVPPPPNGADIPATAPPPGSTNTPPHAITVPHEEKNRSDRWTALSGRGQRRPRPLGRRAPSTTSVHVEVRTG